MTLEVKFELEDGDLERFRALFHEAREKARSAEQPAILQAAHGLLQRSLANRPPEFVRSRLDGLGRLVAMLEDDAWRLPAEERDRIVEALAYFVAPDDLIADATPVLGLLDDAIAAELVLRGLRHEIEAYEEFSRFRVGEAQRRANAGLPVDISKEDWLADRRSTLHSRMRERRVADPVGWHTTLWGNF